MFPGFWPIHVINSIDYDVLFHIGILGLYGEELIVWLLPRRDAAAAAISTCSLMWYSPARDASCRTAEHDHSSSVLGTFWILAVSSVKFTIQSSGISFCLLLILLQPPPPPSQCTGSLLPIPFIHLSLLCPASSSLCVLFFTTLLVRRHMMQPTPKQLFLPGGGLLL